MRKIFGTHPLFSIFKLYDQFIKDGNYLSDLESNWLIKESSHYKKLSIKQKKEALNDLHESINSDSNKENEKDIANTDMFNDEQEKRFKNCRKLIKLFYSLLLKDKVDLLPVYLEYLFHCAHTNSLFSKVSKAEEKKTYNLVNTLVVASFMKSLTQSSKRKEEGYSISDRELFKLEQIIKDKFTMNEQNIETLIDYCKEILNKPSSKENETRNMWTNMECFKNKNQKEKEEFMKKLRYKNFYSPDVLKDVCKKANTLLKEVRKAGLANDSEFFQNISHIPLFTQGGLNEILDKLIL